MNVLELLVVFLFRESTPETNLVDRLACQGVQEHQVLPKQELLSVLTRTGQLSICKRTHGYMILRTLNFTSMCIKSLRSRSAKKLTYPQKGSTDQYTGLVQFLQHWIRSKKLLVVKQFEYSLSHFLLLKEISSR